MRTGVKEIWIKQMPFGQSVIRFKGDDIFSAILMDAIESDGQCSLSIVAALHCNWLKYLEEKVGV